MSKLRINDEAQIYDNKARIISLEADFRNTRDDVREIKDDLKIIKDNHLAHIQKSIEKINLKLAELDPQNKLVWETIKLIISTLVVSALGYLIISKVV